MAGAATKLFLAKRPANFDTLARRERLVQAAATQVGVLESPLGSNRGPEVEEYQATAGYNPGVFWCGCFVYWSAVAAGYGPKELPRKGEAGRVALWRTWALKNGLVIPVWQAARGDIFTLAHADGSGHMGVVLDSRQVGAAYYERTIEGNTNTNGSSNGIGVFRFGKQEDLDVDDWRRVVPSFKIIRLAA